jgi:CHAT domain-containing protein
MDQVRALTLCPGVWLADVPFEALLDEVHTPLARRHELSFAISSAQLGVVAPRWHPAQALLWRPADDLERADEEIAWLSGWLAERSVEVRRLHEWDEGAGARIDLLHYAGHASFDGLAQSEGGLEAALFEREQMDHRPLIVLSACETGRAMAHGQEFVGFLRSMFGAGGRALICASWRAHDEASEALMRLLYEGLFERGLSPPAALKEATAQLTELRPQWGHPFFWASWRCWCGAQLEGA